MSAIATVKAAAANAAPVGVGAMGAILGDMAGFTMTEWLLLAATMTACILTGSFFVAGEDHGMKFWSGVGVKFALGGVAVISTSGSLKVFLPIVIAIGMSDPQLLMRTGRRMGLIADDGSDDDSGVSNKG